MEQLQNVAQIAHVESVIRLGSAGTVYDPAVVFTVEQRDALRERVLTLAENDRRVVAGAAVGSLALGGGDRFSDLDLTFAGADDLPRVPAAGRSPARSVADTRGALRPCRSPVPTAVRRNRGRRAGRWAQAAGPRRPLRLGRHLRRALARVHRTRACLAGGAL